MVTLKIYNIRPKYKNLTLKVKSMGASCQTVAISLSRMLFTQRTKTREKVEIFGLLVLGSCIKRDTLYLHIRMIILYIQK